ncbi:MAG: diguanylate cyclase [Nitrospiria bacterium]
MLGPDDLIDNTRRLEELRSYAVFDTQPEKHFNEITYLVSRICKTPAASISLMDANQLYFKSVVGIPRQEFPKTGLFCSYTVRQKTLFIVENTTTDERFNTQPLVTTPPHIRFYAGAPLISPSGYAIGTLSVLDFVPRVLDAYQREALEILSRQVMTQLELRRQALHDPLTGLLNRRFMNEVLSYELRRVDRSHHPLGLILVDVDYFKQVNDRFGHNAGDDVLKRLGTFIKSHSRSGDIACRSGGEEFAVILPGCPLTRTHQRAESLRTGVKSLILQHQGQSIGRITLSLGVAVCKEAGMQMESFINIADTALYRAKEEGRDKAVVGEWAPDS